MSFRPSFIIILFVLALGACQNPGPPAATSSPPSPQAPVVKMAGAMKNVMWKGKLDDVVKLDTLKPRKGLYALGPGPRLRGELLVLDGQTYWSTVQADSSLQVEAGASPVGAPFLVYGWQNKWQETALPDSVKNLGQLEKWVDKRMATVKEPFPLRLEGRVKEAFIHAQNLAPGAAVSSPQEAHAGQVNYRLSSQPVHIAGFFSRQHQGIFTHHDSFLHLHLLSGREQVMGHLDSLTLGQLKIYLPEKYASGQR